MFYLAREQHKSLPEPPLDAERWWFRFPFMKKTFFISRNAFAMAKSKDEEETKANWRIIQNSCFKILIDFQLLEAQPTKKKKRTMKMEIKKMLCKSRFSELAVGKLSAEDAYTRLKSLQREWEIKHSRGQLNLRGWCRWAGGLWLWLASLRFFSLFNKKWVSSTGKHTNYLQSTAFNDEQKGTERESLDLMITLNSARTRRSQEFAFCLRDVLPALHNSTRNTKTIKETRKHFLSILCIRVREAFLFYISSSPSSRPEPKRLS